MFNSDKEFKYEVNPNFDFILEERANTYIALRKIKWGDKSEEKLDIRKYIAQESGERMMKGCSFSDEAAHELTKIMVEQGYGKDKDIFDAIIDNRPEITTRFIDLFQSSSEKELVEHIKNHPIMDEKEEELYNLDEIV